MQRHLHVLPSSRSIRERLLSLRTSNRFLDAYVTMGEFLGRLLLFDERIRIDSDQRNLLLLEASDFAAFETLGIERQFYTFAQNSHYVFRFLEELSAELVPIETLERGDTYGEYEEHLKILSELYERYGNVCDAHKVIDPIYMQKHYRINESYLKQYDTIALYVEGYVTNFEMTLLEAVSAQVALTLHFETTPYNQKMQDKFSAMGLQLQPHMHYCIDLQQRSIISETPMYRLPMSAVTCKGFSERLLQIAFAKTEVAQMIDAGIAPERIAVIVPDESFAEQLRRFNNEDNFNFAMGIPLDTTLAYRRIDACMQVLDNPTLENRARVLRLAEPLWIAMQERYHEPYTAHALEAILTVALEEAPLAVRERFDEARYHFQSLEGVLSALPMRQALHLFVQRLRSMALDDVGGGKITVMGLLESRACTFEGVVIVDFNDGFVPKPSDKDLFLNSATRRLSGLPTTQERESLQKHYYFQLLSRAKKASLSYVASTSTLPSRFLTQLGITVVDGARNEAAYGAILFDAALPESRDESEITGAYDFTKQPLSASALKKFLTCKRAFYYRYMAHLNEHEMPRELPRESEIGSLLHEALHLLYAEQKSYHNADTMRHAMERILEPYMQRNALVRYQLLLWQKKFESFFASEVTHFAQGWQVYACEKELKIPWGPLTLHGRIDRIDISDDGLMVVDYKSGAVTTYTQKSVDTATDFQLEFYALQASQLGQVTQAAFYDLNSGAIVNEPFFERKMELLQEHLDALAQTTEWEFARCEDRSVCRYCPYNILCGRA